MDRNPVLIFVTIMRNSQITARWGGNDILLILGDDSFGKRLQLFISDDGKDHLACRYFWHTNPSLHIEPELMVINMYRCMDTCHAAMQNSV